MPTSLDPNARRVFLTAAAVISPALSALVAGCASPPEPVAVVRLATNRTQVPVGGSVDVTIQFDVAPGIGPLTENYRVELQVLDGEERILWSTEHDPPIPTSSWQPGQSIRYTERVRFPPYPYIGPAMLAIGLHSPAAGSRVPLAGHDLGDFIYRAVTLTLEPIHESSFVIHEEGWHQIEFDVFARNEWRWTTERAVVSFVNPRQAARLLLNVEGRPDLFEQPQRLSLAVGELTIAVVALDTNARVDLEYEVASADFGSDDVVRLELLVDQTFTPAESGGSAADTRLLGVRVFDVYLEPLPPSNR